MQGVAIISTNLKTYIF